MKPDGLNSVISFVIFKGLLPESSFSDRWTGETKTLGTRSSLKFAQPPAPLKKIMLEDPESIVDVKKTSPSLVTEDLGARTKDFNMLVPEKQTMFPTFFHNLLAFGGIVKHLHCHNSHSMPSYE